MRGLLGVAALAALCVSASAHGQAVDAPPVAVAQTAILPAGTPVLVMLNDELATGSSHVGDIFGVTVLNDVTLGKTIVIPKGTTGTGDVTFASNKGGFGKPGILSISLRFLDLQGKKFALDGRYREEGKNNNGATAATWFAVGIFSGFIKGKVGVIPKGRELRARTGEDIPVTIASPEPASPAAPANPPSQ